MRKIATSDRVDRLTIGEVARRGGVGVETIRYYERRGLLDEPARSAAGYRQYPPDAADRVRFIKRAQELGFTLRQIAELLDLRLDPGATCAAVRDSARAKVAEVEQKIRSLRSMKRALSQLIDACEGDGPAETCTILRSLDREAR